MLVKTLFHAACGLLLLVSLPVTHADEMPTLADYPEDGQTTICVQQQQPVDAPVAEHYLTHYRAKGNECPLLLSMRVLDPPTKIPVNLGLEVELNATINLKFNNSDVASFPSLPKSENNTATQISQAEIHGCDHQDGCDVFQAGSHPVVATAETRTVTPNQTIFHQTIMFSTSGDKMVWGHVVLPLQTAAGASSMHFMVFTSLHIGGSAAAATTSDSSKQQTGIIIGIVVAALAAICVIVMLWRHWRRRPRLTNNQLFHLQTTAPAPAPLTEDAVKALQPITWTEEPVYPADEYQSIRETTSLANEFIGAPHQRRASSLTFDDIPATASEASFVAVTTPVNTSQRTQGSVHVPPARPLRNQVRFANIPSRSSASSHASEEVPPAPLSPQESVASVGTTMTSDFAMSQQPQQLPAPHTGSYRVVGDTPCFTNAAQPALWSVEEGNEEGASPRSDGMSTLAAPSIFSDDDDGAGNSMRTIQFPISQPPAERASSQQAPSRPSNNLEFDPNTTVTL